MNYHVALTMPSLSEAHSGRHETHICFSILHPFNKMLANSACIFITCAKSESASSAHLYNGIPCLANNFTLARISRRRSLFSLLSWQHFTIKFSKASLWTTGEVRVKSLLGQFQNQKGWQRHKTGHDLTSHWHTPVLIGSKWSAFAHACTLTYINIHMYHLL